MKYLLSQWPLTPTQRQHLILRSDAEQGTDENIRYLLWLNIQILMKGYSGRRTGAWVQQLAPTAWIADPRQTDRWAAPAPARLQLGRHLDAYLLRWRNQQQEFVHATLLSTLPGTVFTLWNLYDGRGTDEVEIRADKSGLNLTHRRKQRLNAQEGWLLLTDTAHNLLAWLHPWMLTGSAFAQFGPLRIVNDLMCIPGQVTFKGQKLQKVALQKTHPYAPEMCVCLQKLLKTFDLQ